MSWTRVREQPKSNQFKVIEAAKGGSGASCSCGRPNDNKQTNRGPSKFFRMSTKSRSGGDGNGGDRGHRWPRRAQVMKSPRPLLVYCFGLALLAIVMLLTANGKLPAASVQCQEVRARAAAGASGTKVGPEPLQAISSGRAHRVAATASGKFKFGMSAQRCQKQFVLPPMPLLLLLFSLYSVVQRQEAKESTAKTGRASSR